MRYEQNYHYEIRLLPEGASFWEKFNLMLGKPLLAYLAASYLCYLLGLNFFLDVPGFVMFLMESSGLHFLFPFPFIWMGMLLLQVGDAVERELFRNKKNYIKVNAKINSVKTYGEGALSPDDIGYQVSVSYTVNGVTYDNVMLDHYNNEMAQSGSVELTIDPLQPEEPVTALGGTKILAVLGWVFLSIGTFVILLSHYAD